VKQRDNFIEKKLNKRKSFYSKKGEKKRLKRKIIEQKVKQLNFELKEEFTKDGTKG
jgi:hypothetical protein